MKKEKIHLLCMIILCLITIPFVTNAQEQEPARPRRRLVEEQQVKKEEKIEPITSCGFHRPMKVAGFIANPPFSWVERTDDDKLVTYGYSLDVFKKIAKKLKLRYESVGFTSYDETIGALKRGEIDLLLAAYLPHTLGIGATPVYPAYFTNFTSIYFRSDKLINFSSLEDLAGLQGIIRREENLYRLFKNKRAVKKLNLRQVSTSQKAFEMLLNGEADYLIGSPYAIEAELRRLKLKKQIVSSKVSGLESGANLFFVLSSNSSCVKLRDLLSKEVQNYVDSDVAEAEVREAVDNWGEEFRNEEGMFPSVVIEHELPITTSLPKEEETPSEPEE